MTDSPDGSMSLLDHLDEFRSRLMKIVGVFVVCMAACWGVSGYILDFLLLPIQENFFEGGEIVFIHLSEPFMIYMKASALVARVRRHRRSCCISCGPLSLPACTRKRATLVVPFLFFGTPVLRRQVGPSATTWRRPVAAPTG